LEKIFAYKQSFKSYIEKEGHKLFFAELQTLQTDIVQYLRFWHWCFWRVNLSYPAAQHNIPDGLQLKQNTI